MIFHEEKGLAMCGLACALCSEEACPGCARRGCKDMEGCSVIRCAAGKGLDGCYACEAFPCGEGMLKGVRNRAFNRYARQFGRPALLERLQANYGSGIIYHRPGGLKGDYDVPETEDGIMRLIRFGGRDPFESCPTADTERFTLRLVSREDAGELLACYSDPQAQRFFNADRCTGDFRYQTREEMLRCIDFWLDEYRRRVYIRLSIIDRHTRRAVGTMEVFDLNDRQLPGILRLDVASAYENADRLGELFRAGAGMFFDVFHSEAVVTKAVPEAAERIAALRAGGWREAEGREHYFILKG